MLLNKKIAAAALSTLLFVFILVSCGKKEPDAELSSKEQLAKNMSDPAFILNESKNLLGKETKNAYSGHFTPDSVFQIAAGKEINTKEQWGIQFYLLKEKGEKFVSVYHTNLLEGSFRESLTNKIKFPFLDYELIYYNSQDYFMGSGGGEIFSYLIDFNLKKTYYAHLFFVPEKPVSLFLSENIEEQKIKDFFTSIFKRDYPEVQLVAVDYNME